ncbi:Amino acid ABC transporter substrate-binding protein [Pseudomonas sp. 8Z]|uniref:substrate-binding periplasmic protein n=1 Tax=Pseudomonas sp. 8Z TaxID=2653166 RepID=UPI0012EF49DE|nr:transporter substrate-binding domain-containing protein [Pseudomonas sp. 8Z]VXC08588.1 Amino acid ABC transporter substrate-binding protein [Pseudomonas sp. 8Z]
MQLLLRQIISTFLLCGLALCAKAQTLHLVTEAWPPYVFEQDGQPTGLDYEVTREVLKRLGIDLQLHFMPWKRCLLAMDQGHADGILDIFQRPEREAHMQFVMEPLSEIEFVLFFARNRPVPYNNLTDLKGRVVGISAGYWYHNDAFQNASDFSREEAPTHKANFGKLIRHRVDLVVNDRRTGLFLAKEMGLETEIGYHSTRLGRDHLRLALRKTPEMNELSANFARELRRFKDEPGYRNLQQRYIDSLEPSVAQVVK